MKTENLCTLHEHSSNRVMHLNHSLRLFVLSLEQAILVGDSEHLVLTGEDQVAMIKLIDGTRTDSEIIDIVSTRTGDLRALTILDQFETRGICSGRVSTEDGDDTLLYRQKQIVPKEHLAALQSKNLFLECFQKDRDVVLIEEALQRAGIRFTYDNEGEKTAFHLVVTNDLFDPRLDVINKRNIEQNQPWLVVNPTGSTPMFVPLLDTTSGPCWACLLFWLRVNRPVEEYIRRKTENAILHKFPGFEPAVRVLAEQVAFAARSLLLDNKMNSPDIVTIDAHTLQYSRHTVRKRPQCHFCGNPDLMTEQGYRPILLTNVEKGDCEDGGYRHKSPAATYIQFRHLVSPVIGPVSHLGPMPGRHTASRPVFVSGYRVCPSSEEIDSTSFQRVCAGKGRNIEQARVSALFEAVERFSGLYQGDEAIIQGSWNDLRQSAFHPHALQLFSDNQYSAWTIADINKNGALRIAKHYTGDKVIDWTPAWSLTHNQRRLVPFTYCYSDTPSHINRAYTCYNGNGVAAGTCLEEAILQGLFELVERDAVAVWWYNRINRPLPDPVLFNGPYVEKMKKEYQNLGWDLWALDLTHDLLIPVYAALAQSRQDQRFCIGFGCHLNSKLALHRALTELNQLFDPQGTVRTPWDHKALTSNEFLFSHGESKAKPQVFQSENTSLRGDIEECICKLNKSGLELLVVNKTRPDTGVHVAHTIVPGLRHFWPRFGPGRLYTVPVDMGWHDLPLAEEILNTVPLLV